MQTEINGTFNSMKYSSLNFCKLTKRTEFSEINKFKGRLKPRPNDRSMPTQHVATLLGATCCVRLATVLRCVATCWVLLAQIWPFSNLSQRHPICRNTSQHGGQTHATCCTQQRCDMLRCHVAIVWPGLNPGSLCVSCTGFITWLSYVLGPNHKAHGSWYSPNYHQLSPWSNSQRSWW